MTISALPLDTIKLTADPDDCGSMMLGSLRISNVTLDIIALRVIKGRTRWRSFCKGCKPLFDHLQQLPSNHSEGHSYVTPGLDRDLETTMVQGQEGEWTLFALPSQVAG